LIVFWRRALCWLIGCVFSTEPFPDGARKATCLRCGTVWEIPRDEDDDDFETPGDLPADKTRKDPA